MAMIKYAEHDINNLDKGLSNVTKKTNRAKITKLIASKNSRQEFLSTNW